MKKIIDLDPKSILHENDEFELFDSEVTEHRSKKSSFASLIKFILTIFESIHLIVFSLSCGKGNKSSSKSISMGDHTEIPSDMPCVFSYNSGISANLPYSYTSRYHSAITENLMSADDSQSFFLKMLSRENSIFLCHQSSIFKLDLSGLILIRNTDKKIIEETSFRYTGIVDMFNLEFMFSGIQDLISYKNLKQSKSPLLFNAILSIVFNRPTNEYQLKLTINNLNDIAINWYGAGFDARIFLDNELLSHFDIRVQELYNDNNFLLDK